MPLFLIRVELRDSIMVLELGQSVCREMIECLQGLQNTNTSSWSVRPLDKQSGSPGCEFSSLDGERQIVFTARTMGRAIADAWKHTLHVLRHIQTLSISYIHNQIDFRSGFLPFFVCSKWKTEETLMDGSHYRVSFNICPTSGCCSLIDENELVWCSWMLCSSYGLFFRGSGDRCW